MLFFGARIPMEEINYLLFQSVLGVTFIAAAAYLVYFVSQNKKIRKIARLILLLSGILQTLHMVSRFILAGHTPITSQHEAVVFFAWATTWAYLSFRWRYTVKNFGTFVSILIFCLLLISSFSSRDFAPLLPALQSMWLPIHAGVSIIAYGFLSLAFCGGLMYLLQERELKSKKFGYFFSRFPSLDALDQLNNHCLTTGFVFLTLGIVTGSVWARQAWGTYWQWDPKEDLVVDNLVSLPGAAASAIYRRLARKKSGCYGHHRICFNCFHPVGRNIFAWRRS